MEEKTLDDFRQPNGIETLAFGHSMPSRGACVEAETSFAAAAPSSIEWPNANLPKALAETRTNVFFFHPLPARNIASNPSIARTSSAAVGPNQVQLGQTRSEKLIGEPSSPVIGCMCPVTHGLLSYVVCFKSTWAKLPPRKLIGKPSSPAICCVCPMTHGLL